MKQVWITRAGEPETMAVREAPDPVPGRGEVRIRVHAAGVNFADVMMRLGIYPDAPALPAVPGYEAAGVIDAVGEGVDDGLVGTGAVAFRAFGCYADVICVDRRFAFPLPEGMPAAVGAGLIVNYVTAWQMVEAMAPVREGMTVLIHGAAGGVGLAAVQLCRRRGARILGSASPAKHAFLREAGVEAVFDSRRRHYASSVLAATGGLGCDVVLEPRNGRWIGESYDCLGATGRLILFGFSDAAVGKRGSKLAALRTLASVPWLRLNPMRLINDNRGVMGVNVGRLWDRREMVAGWIAEILAGVEQGWIAPRIDRGFRLEDAAKAHHFLQDRRNVGKVVLLTGAGLAAGPGCRMDGDGNGNGNGGEEA